MTKNILVIEDKPSQLRFAQNMLGYKFTYLTINKQWQGNELSKQYRDARQPDVVLVDLLLGEASHIKTIQTIKIQKPHWPIIAFIPYGYDEVAMQAIAAGATDFITKPASLDRLNLTLQNVLKMQNMNEAIARLERTDMGQVHFDDIIGKNSAIKRAVAQAEMLASSDVPVWIEGEGGTGKELFARAIHRNRAQAGNRFIAVNCSKLAATTDAADSLHYFVGKMHEVGSGTLYLKDIHLLPPALQQCLQDTLQSGRLPVLADKGTKPVQFRMIMGSNQPVEQINDNPSFMPLYKTLYGMVLSLPPLRQRKEDITSLARYFIKIHAASENKMITDLSEDAIKLLEHNPWPGNITQLSRTLQRAVLLSSSSHLDAGTLRLIQQLEPVQYTGQNKAVSLAPSLVDIGGKIKKLKFIEEEAIRFALVHSGGSMTRAARNLGIGRSTLYRKIGDMEGVVHNSRENQTTRPTITISATDRS